MSTKNLGVHFRGCHSNMKVEVHSMDLMVGYPLTIGSCHSIWVIMDFLTKSIHFIFVKVKYMIEKLAHLYIN